MYLAFPYPEDGDIVAWSQKCMAAIFDDLNTYLADDIRILIRYQCAVRGISVSEFARRCHLAPIQLTNVMKGRKFTHRVACSIAGGLGFQSCSALMEEGETPAWEERVDQAKQYLCDVEKEALVEAERSEKVASACADAASLILPIAKSEIKTWSEKLEGELL